MIVKRLVTGAALAVGLLALSACQAGLEDLVPHQAPLPDRLVQEIRAKGMGINSPILVRLFKEESDLEVWKQKTDGTYALLETYEICAWSGKLGPKKAEGDRQAPEGFYTVTPAQLNPNSQHHLAFNMGYPNAFDRAHGRTGAHLMVHGSCNSSGCYAMDNEQIEEIYALARHSFQGGQRAFQIQAYPFRMTPENMARHRNSEHYAFWKMLKQGSDHFEVTKRQPEVGVCENRYAFDAGLAPGHPAAAQCPQVAEPMAVAAKRIEDEAEEQQIAARMSPSDFATTSTFSYRTGQPITADAYAAEQHRRPGYDRLGNKTGGAGGGSIFSSFFD